MKVGIKKETVDKMVELRKSGATYNQIRKEIGVSKSSCIKYLKDIKVDEGYARSIWKTAEKEAKDILIKKGFGHIVNLNEICPNSPYWDYYAEKDEGRWLIDVTTSQSKDVVDKFARAVEGYKHAILYKHDNEWSLVEIRLKKM